ncbi:MAG TPA: SMC-Scp complex subunit ScpB [Syntrophales bacterium]|mgnify:CR=1 FL=1|nr:SMC-Scp complex subunit ScpB [Syntrophales bacterium]HOL58482.1 SMC-Scp complex subunit ScpB [Syntrophales bacterium]HPO34910.1 SMC-Scp complex subunit ScpB [Syntrophales bacterium]
MLTNNLKNILESIIFASESPLSLDKIYALLVPEGFDKKEISRALRELKEEYRLRQGGFLLAEVAGGFQFRTRPEYATWIKKMRSARSSPITQAALETLAIIAYRQPVIKMEIDKIRGVDSGGVIRSLMERRLIRILGRKDVPGRPIMYGTTKHFLEMFNLKDLSELPTVKELKDLEGHEGSPK